MIYRNYGVEIELGNIYTAMAARIVFDNQGLDYRTDWKDRGYSGFTKVSRYDIWNVSSDGTIKNTDGTRCMHTVMVDGKIKSYHDGNKHLNRGAEVISPIITPETHDQRQFEFISTMSDLRTNGAVCKPELRHAFHVHIDVRDWDLDRMKEFLRWVEEMQETLSNYIQSAYKAEYPMRLYKKTLIEKMCDSKSEEELWYWYRMHHKNKGQPSLETQFQFRRLICLGSRLNSLHKDRGTLEWRLWPATLHFPSLRNFIEFSQECTQNLPSKQYVLDWMEQNGKNL